MHNGWTKTPRNDMKPSHLVLPYFNVREEKMETGLWICSALSHLSSGSATNQSLKFMPPLDEKGMGGKEVTDSPWKEWCERGDSEKKTDRQRRKSQEKDDFWAASSQKDFFPAAAWFTSLHPSPVPSPSLHHPLFPFSSFTCYFSPSFNDIYTHI